MTVAAYFIAAGLLCFVVSIRVRAVRKWNGEKAKRAPVVFEQYVGAIPKPLSAAQVKALEERREFIRTHPYRANTYTD